MSLRLYKSVNMHVHSAFMVRWDNAKKGFSTVSFKFVPHH